MHNANLLPATTAPSSPEPPPTDSAPRPTRAPSMLACVLSTAAESPAGSGPRAASSSRPSPAYTGKSTGGLLRPSPSPPSPLPRTASPPRLPPPPMAAAARRTRRTGSARRARATTTAPRVPTSKCRACPASKLAHPRPCLSRQAHRGRTSLKCYIHQELKSSRFVAFSLYSSFISAII